ncbi:LysR family transcriptional regulator [Aestuariivirga litoralis]|uniref:LysR family transcriptional regulator n=1 Tax=Aestuariivirga litoralis TaxID=2650924 RepID=A0A2W2ATQ2_9HYPH|nr:DoxX family protein [Aestuariivirga litoralis]PZF75920.1 LysR family transcriptional regulator [Aestuariivirga litoralis]
MTYAATERAPLAASAASVDYAALLLRVSMGVGFIAHAYLKYAIFTPAGTVQYFQSLGLPGPLAYVVMAAEFFGGIALVLGLWTRWVSLALLPIMLGAIFAHAGNGFFFTAANGGWEFPAFWAVALAVQALIGGGAFALKR